MKIVICSGGTGGHMFPACVLFRRMREKNHDVSMITDGRGDVFCGDISQKIVLNTVRFSCARILGVVRHFISTFSLFFRLWKKERPDIILGFGGILTFIPLITAKILRSKVMIYEQNAIVGRANKFLEKIADLKLSTFALGEDWVKITAPVREEFTTSVPYQCDGKMNILILGGSQGAASFAKIIPDALSMIDSRERKNIEIIQQVGDADREKLRQAYDNIEVKSTLERFVHNVAEIMSSVQLIICRSGASTLSELSAMGRPAILIPYPNSSGNHQLYNAIYYKNKKAAWVWEEKGGEIQELAEIIKQILCDRELLKSAAFNMMRSSAGTAGDFIELIENVSQGQ